MLPFLLLFSSQLALSASLAASPDDEKDVPQWHFSHNVDGMKVEVREVEDSPFEEIRVSTFSDLGIDSLCDAVWAKGRDSSAAENFKKRVVIRESENERLVYEQIHVPLVCDRDYVLRVTLSRPNPSGGCAVRFETTKHPSWPELRDHVRIPAIRGSWDLSPDKNGKVAITYVVYSDPGGSVPPFLVRGPQKETAVEFMKVILQRAKGKTP